MQRAGYFQNRIGIYWSTSKQTKWAQEWHVPRCDTKIRVSIHLCVLRIGSHKTKKMTNLVFQIPCSFRHIVNNLICIGFPFLALLQFCL